MFMDKQVVALLYVERKVRTPLVAQRVMPFHRKVRTSGTERMSSKFLNLAGVKTAKLCAERDQVKKIY